MRVDRCVCTNQRFDAVLQQAAKLRLSTVDQIAECTGAGGRCGRCRPYLARGLAHGTTTFHQLLPAEDPCPLPAVVNNV